MLRPFCFHEPATVGDATRLLAEFKEQARVYGGGTELLLVMKEGLARFKHLINVKSISGQNDIKFENGCLNIGAVATHRMLEDSEEIRKYFPVIAEMEQNIANIRVRNVGTIGGNLCFAEPHSDPATLFLVYDALVELAGLGGSRSLPLREFTLGPLETALRDGEILTHIKVPSMPQGMEVTYLKFGYLERPTIGVAGAVKLNERDEVQEARFAVGSLGDKPVRLDEVEALFQGKEVREGLSLLPKAVEFAYEKVPVVTDLYGTEAYKRHLLMVFLKRAFQRACQKSNGEGHGSGV